MLAPDACTIKRLLKSSNKNYHSYDVELILSWPAYAHPSNLLTNEINEQRASSRSMYKKSVRRSALPFHPLDLSFYCCLSKNNAPLVDIRQSLNKFLKQLLSAFARMLSGFYEILNVALSSYFGRKICYEKCSDLLQPSVNTNITIKCLHANLQEQIPS